MSMNCSCDCDCEPSQSGSISGNVSCQSTLRGRIYAPTFVSAYDIAVQHGYEGTEEEWLESLKGEDGKSAYQIDVEHGYVGTEEEWLRSLRGPAGESAYQIAVDSGFEGTQEEWLASLVGPAGEPGPAGADGPEGPQGESAYQIAVDHGYEGTEEDWIAEVAANQIIIESINEQIEGVQETLDRYGLKLDPIFEAERESQEAGNPIEYKLVVTEKEEDDEKGYTLQDKLTASEIIDICVL